MFLQMSLIVFSKLDAIVRGKSVLKDISWASEPRQRRKGGEKGTELFITRKL